MRAVACVGIVAFTVLGFLFAYAMSTYHALALAVYLCIYQIKGLNEEWGPLRRFVIAATLTATMFNLIGAIWFVFLGASPWIGIGKLLLLGVISTQLLFPPLADSVAGIIQVVSGRKWSVLDIFIAYRNLLITTLNTLQRAARIVLSDHGLKAATWHIPIAAASRVPLISAEVVMARCVRSFSATNALRIQHSWVRMATWSYVGITLLILSWILEHKG